jgi:hypothetical protein
MHGRLQCEKAEWKLESQNGGIKGPPRPFPCGQWTVRKDAVESTTLARDEVGMAEMQNVSPRASVNYKDRKLA